MVVGPDHAHLARPLVVGHADDRDLVERVASATPSSGNPLKLIAPDTPASPSCSAHARTPSGSSRESRDELDVPPLGLVVNRGADRTRERQLLPERDVADRVAGAGCRLDRGEAAASVASADGAALEAGDGAPDDGAAALDVTVTQPAARRRARRTPRPTWIRPWDDESK